VTKVERLGEGAGEKFEDFETHFRIKWCKIHEAPHTAAQLFGVPHGILRVFHNFIRK
jgi:hypothetical protein